MLGIRNVHFTSQNIMIYEKNILYTYLSLVPAAAALLYRHITTTNFSKKLFTSACGQSLQLNGCKNT